MAYSVKCVSYAAFTFGFLSMAALAIAVSTDFWLYTRERLSLDAAGIGRPPKDERLIPDLCPFVVYENVHLGLWRACVYYPDMQG